MAYALSTISDRAGQGTRAVRVATRSIRPHQMYAAAALGRTRGGTQRHAPVVVNDQLQDWSASCRAGVASLRHRLDTTRGLPGSGPSHSSPAVMHGRPSLGQAGNSRAVASVADARNFFPRRILGCRPVRVQLLQDKHPQYRAVPVVDHLRRLSSVARLVGSQPSEALNGRVPNSSGAFQKTEGELPNVCC